MTPDSVCGNVDITRAERDVGAGARRAERSADCLVDAEAFDPLCSLEGSFIVSCDAFDDRTSPGILKASTDPTRTAAARSVFGLI